MKFPTAIKTDSPCPGACSCLLRWPTRCLWNVYLWVNLLYTTEHRHTHTHTYTHTAPSLTLEFFPALSQEATLGSRARDSDVTHSLSCVNKMGCWQRRWVLRSSLFYSLDEKGMSTGYKQTIVLKTIPERLKEGDWWCELWNTLKKFP